MKRRILDELRLTEISGVDRPCQEGARVAIMKRAPETNLAHLEYRVATLQNTINELQKWSDASRMAAARTRRLRHRTQPKHRGLKAAGLALAGTPALGAAYLYATRRSKYD